MNKPELKILVEPRAEEIISLDEVIADRGKYGYPRFEKLMELVNVDFARKFGAANAFQRDRDGWINMSDATFVDIAILIFEKRK